MSVLTSNERVQRLERAGLQFLRCRLFADAEEAFRDQLAILRDFRYVDELSLIITLNNLALSLELQGKHRQAELIRKTSSASQVEFASSTTPVLIAI
jgi:hypothetical protein